MTATPSRPGRPRDTRRDDDILAAVLHLLADTPYPELTIAAIARTAGVGKPTLDLRWPSTAFGAAGGDLGTIVSLPFFENALRG